MSVLTQRLRKTLDDLRSAGTYKALRHLQDPMGPVTTIEGLGDVLVFCSNNYRLSGAAGQFSLSRVRERVGARVQLSLSRLRERVGVRSDPSRALAILRPQG